MVLIPSLTTMLLVIGVALAITVVATAAVGALLTLGTERRHHVAPRVAHPAVPAQRTEVREPVSTH